MYRTVLLSLFLYAALCLAEGALQPGTAQKTKGTRGTATVAADAPAAPGKVPVPGKGHFCSWVGSAVGSKVGRGRLFCLAITSEPLAFGNKIL